MNPSLPATGIADALMRPLKDLRLSVIDQCNFRCTYCMPKEVFTRDYPFLRAAQQLSFDEMTLLARTRSCRWRATSATAASTCASSNTWTSAAPGAGGEVGFIASVSKPFCGDCTRARVSADGKLFLCLFATRPVDPRPWLRAGHTGLLEQAIRATWNARADRYSEQRGALRAGSGAKRYPVVRMSLVGG